MHGTAHFVGFQGVGAGHPRLQAGVPGFDLIHRLSEEGQVLAAGGVPVAFRGHQKQEEFVIFGKKVAGSLKIIQFLGEKAAKQGALGLVAFQAGREPPEGSVQQGQVRQFRLCLIGQEPGEDLADHGPGDLVIHQPVKGGQARVRGQARQQVLLFQETVFDLVKIRGVQIEQGRAFESFRVDVIEEFGKVVRVAPQLGGQVVGELDGPLGMPILHHHHHAIPAPKGPVHLFALLDKALVTGDQIVAAGANGQVRHGIINRRHGQHHGYCQKGPGAQSKAAH